MRKLKVSLKLARLCRVRRKPDAVIGWRMIKMETTGNEMILTNHVMG